MTRLATRGFKPQAVHLQSFFSAMSAFWRIMFHGDFANWRLNSG